MGRLTVGSLFSGIGGLDLGLERAGMRMRWQAETDGYASSVLALRWPGVRNLGDVTKVDWTEIERVDLVCGGFPCQPFSTAGKRRGTDDERWLWPEFERCLRVLRPRYVVVENVPGFLGSWGGMGQVLGDLAAIGYDAEWESVPAAAVGAPHLRYRVFILAVRARPGEGDAPRPDADGQRRQVADANSAGLQVLSGVEAGAELGRIRAAWGGGWWAAEPDVGRVAHGVPSRVDRLRCLGNAVVPPVAEWLGRRVVLLDRSLRGAP